MTRNRFLWLIVFVTSCEVATCFIMAISIVDRIKNKLKPQHTLEERIANEPLVSWNSGNSLPAVSFSDEQLVIYDSKGKEHHYKMKEVQDAAIRELKEMKVKESGK